ncbi:phosphoethanolamine transferase [Helicobacter salomonis]|uniref:phosphoethanolamine transferase n=1 Tax=Helicobacter salomonis TaxID=56878 RepID=UPI000CF1A597|nr:phosphoethanolamine transferase [Helicobacter salomonis]
MVLDNRFLLCWVSFVLASVFSPDAHLSYLSKTLLKVAFYSGAFFYALYTLLSFLPTRLSNLIKNTIVVLSLLVAFLRFFMGYIFNMDINQALIETLLGTNVQEVRSFLIAHVFSHSFLILGVGGVCALFLAFVRFKWSLPPKLHALFLGMFILGVVAHMGRTAYLFHQRGATGWTPPEIWDTLPLIKEVRAIYFGIGSDAQAVHASLNKPYPKDYLRVDRDSVDNVVLIVGESASRNFMGVYGYSVPNTPFFSGLVERERSQNLFVFDNIISAFANTHGVFQTLLNYSDYENHATAWYEQKNLGDIFKRAGYKTFWLDNQDQARTSNAYELLPRRFEKIFRTPSWSTGDQALLDVFNKRVLPHLGAKNVVAFHLIGSHLLYKERFPKSFAKFTPAQIPYQGLHVKNEADKQIVADYVNSLYYTDHVLEGIFKLFEDKDAVIVYLSDHAQDIFESDNTYGHRCSTYGVEIPFVIYVTDLFKQKHPEKVKQLAQAVHKPFMSDDLIHTLLPLAGVHTKDNIESKDLLSPQFDTTRQRVYCNDIPYKQKP